MPSKFSRICRTRYSFEYFQIFHCTRAISAKFRTPHTTPWFHGTLMPTWQLLVIGLSRCLESARGDRSTDTLYPCIISLVVFARCLTPATDDAQLSYFGPTCYFRSVDSRDGSIRRFSRRIALQILQILWHQQLPVYLQPTEVHTKRKCRLRNPFKN